MKVGIVRRLGKIGEHLHGGLAFGSVISGRLIRLSIERPLRGCQTVSYSGRPDPGRVCGDVDAELPQAGECAVDALLDFRLHDMQPDFKVINCRAIHS